MIPHCNRYSCTGCFWAPSVYTVKQAQMLWQNILSPTHGPRTHPRNQSFESPFHSCSCKCCVVMCCAIVMWCVVLWCTIVLCCGRLFVGHATHAVCPLSVQIDLLAVCVRQDLSCQCLNDLLSGCTRICHANVQMICCPPGRAHMLLWDLSYQC